MTAYQCFCSTLMFKKTKRATVCLLYKNKQDYNEYGDVLQGGGDNSLEECKATADCAAKDSQILQTDPSLYVFLQHYTQFSSI